MASLPELAEHLLGRITASVSRSSLLRCSVSRRRGRLADLSWFDCLGQDEPQKIFSRLISGRAVQCRFSLTPRDEEAEEDLHRPQRELYQMLERRVYRHAELAKRETGVHALWLGYPLLYAHAFRHSEQYVLAPVLLWPVEIAFSTRQVGLVSLRPLADAPPVLNDPLAARVQEYLGVGLSPPELDQEERLEESALYRYVKELAGRLGAEMSEGFPALEPVPERKALGQGPRVFSSAVLGFFRWPLPSVLKNLQELREREDEQVPPPLAQLLDPQATAPSEESRAGAEESGGRVPFPPEKDRWFVCPADHSQQQVVFQAREAPALVVHGPPGTGKSQTIVNLIADALAHGRTVLMVCQKQAATRVVMERLRAVGLDKLCVELYDPESQRTSFFKEVRRIATSHPNSQQGELFAASKREELIQQLEQTECRLETYHTMLHHPDPDSGLTRAQLWQHRGRLQQTWERLPQLEHLKPLLIKWSHQRLQPLLSQVDQWAQWVRRSGWGATPWANRHRHVSYTSQLLSQVDRLLRPLRDWNTQYVGLLRERPVLDCSWDTLAQTRHGCELALKLLKQLGELDAPEGELLGRLFQQADLGTAGSLGALASLLTGPAVDACRELARGTDPQWLQRVAKLSNNLREQLNEATDQLVQVPERLRHRFARLHENGLSQEQLLALEQGLERLRGFVASAATVALLEQALQNDAAETAAFTLLPEEDIRLLEDLKYLGWRAFSTDQLVERRRLLESYRRACRSWWPADWWRRLKLGWRLAQLSHDELPAEAILEHGLRVVEQAAALRRRLATVLPPVVHKQLASEPLLATLESLADWSLWQREIPPLRKLLAENPWLQELWNELRSPTCDAAQRTQLLEQAQMLVQGLRRAGTVLPEVAQRELLLETEKLHRALLLLKQEQPLADELRKHLAQFGVSGVSGGSVLHTAQVTRRLLHFVKQWTSLEQKWPEAQRLGQALRSSHVAERLRSWQELFDATIQRCVLLEKLKGLLAPAEKFFQEPELQRAKHLVLQQGDLSAWIDQVQQGVYHLRDLEQLEQAMDRWIIQGGQQSLEALVLKTLTDQRTWRWLAAQKQKNPLQMEPAVFGRWWAAVVEYTALVAWEEQLLKRHPEIQNYDTNDYETDVGRLRQLVNEKQQIEPQAILRRWHEGQARLRGRHWEQVFQLRSSRKRRAPRTREAIHTGITQGLLQLKPCWLVNPEVAAQVFPLRAGLFDLVIFDEASQCPLEQALPALFRGKQVVVAGDEKQLPPTSFFQSRVDGDEEEEEESPEELSAEQIRQQLGRDALFQAEDLLQAAISSYEEAWLKIHYRSDHPALIEFSNRVFYQGKLEAPPSCRGWHDGQVPLEFIEAKGIYEDRTNRREAEIVVDLLARWWLEHSPVPTIGVVTFNLQQRDLIEDLILKRCYEDPEFEAAYERERNRRDGEQDVGFFVKNLENVQGDERELIIFSTTFGPDASGAFRRQFGPVGAVGGQRRLNVAITRAKRRIVVVCSMPLEQIAEPDPAPSAEALTPRQCLQYYLQYVQMLSRGQIDQARQMLQRLCRQAPAWGHGEPESPLEEEVLEELQKRGFLVDCQVGDAGFRIDLAVRHPEPGRGYVLGIECDGARYHSSLSARLRDVWREDILRSRGWKLYRVWSTRWWRDREKERDRLLRAVEEASNGAAEQPT